MSMSTFSALIFIIKATIQMYLFLIGKISTEEFHKSLSAMQESITKATTGNLSNRMDGGSEIENQINQHVGGGP